jgi:hypothetical protein
VKESWGLGLGWRRYELSTVYWRKAYKRILGIISGISRNGEDVGDVWVGSIYRISLEREKAYFNLLCTITGCT